MLQWWQVYGECCSVKTAPELNPQRGEAATQGKALTGTSLGDSTEGPKVPRVPTKGPHVPSQPSPVHTMQRAGVAMRQLIFCQLCDKDWH